MKYDEFSNSDFRCSFDTIQNEVHRVNVANGWWSDRRGLILSNLPGAAANTYIACLGLVATEVSEAIEAIRKQPPETWGDRTKPDTLVREMAGTIVRLMDLAGELRLPLGSAVIEELEANKKRGFRHGNKAA